VVTIAYYAVILWAGVVSGPQAVFFAVVASGLCFSAIVVSEYAGLLSPVSFLGGTMPLVRVASLLLGHISFFLAFGYFSAHSSDVVKSLERKRLEQSLKYQHKLTATGYLLNSIAHDIINHLATIRGYAKILSMQVKDGEGSVKKYDSTRILQQIERLESENIDLLSGLWKFSKGWKEDRQATDVNEAIEDAIRLTTPLTKMSRIVIDRNLEKGLPSILADKNQIQEVLVTLILNLLEDGPRRNRINLETHYHSDRKCIGITLRSSGTKSPQDPGEAPEESGLSFDVAEEIIARHGGTIRQEALPGRGVSIFVELPRCP